MLSFRRPAGYPGYLRTAMREKIPEEKGFTMLEVLLAMTILAIGVLSVAGLAGTAVRSSGYSRALTQANNVAQEKIERLQGVSYLNLESSDTTTSLTDLRRTCTQTDTSINRPVYSCVPVTTAVTLGNSTFNWSYTVTIVDLNGNGTASSTSDGLKRVDVVVSWTDPLWHSTKSVTYFTLRSRD